MLAYPVVDRENLARCLCIADKTRLIFRIDCEESGAFINSAFEQAGKIAEYVVKVDVGLHRFGVGPAEVSTSFDS